MGTNSVVVNVETDVNILVVQEVSVVLVVSVVVVGSRLITVSVGPGTDTVWTEVSVGPGTDMVGPGTDTVGPGTVSITEISSVSVSVAVVCETTVVVLIEVVPGTIYCQLSG